MGRPLRAFIPSPRSKRDQGPAWLPPENTWETITLGLTHLVRTAADRQRLLNPDSGMKIEVGDLQWIVGDRSKIRSLG